MKISDRIGFSEDSMIPLAYTVGDYSWLYGESITRTISLLVADDRSLWGGTPARLLSVEEAEQMAVKNPDSVWTGDQP